MTIEAGTKYTKDFSFTTEDVKRFAEVTGDANPIHLDEGYAKARGLKGTIVHGFLTGSIFSRVFGTEFPGEGTIYLQQTMSFRAPVYPGEALVAELEVTEATPKGKYTLRTDILARDSRELKVTGEAIVLYRT